MAEPSCKYFGKCSGCSLQHIDYSQTLENKRKLAFRLTGFPDIKVFHAEPYGYRNKMEFLFYPGGIGFRKKDEPGKIVDIGRCEIATPRINELLFEVREYFKEVDAKTFKQAVIRSTGKVSAIIFVLNENSHGLGDAVERIKGFITTAENVIIAYKADEDITEHFVVKGTDKLSETLCGKDFLFHPLGFFQNNTAVAEKMQDYVRGILGRYDTKDGDLKNANLLDLYSGVGTFGIINADRFKSVVMLESFAPCIEQAKENLKINDVKNATAIALDAEKMGRLRFPGRWFVITDPPRSGMEEKAIISIKKIQPELIIYVSCNIEQLSKDIKKFKQHKLVSMALFDMFPQTNHVETVVELVRIEK